MGKKLKQIAISILLTFSFMLGSVSVKAQFNDSVFLSKQDQFEQAELVLDFNSFGYFLNQEYFNPMVYSFTAAGYHITPKLTYQIADNIQISTGFYLLNSLGRDKLLEVMPIFNLSYSPFQNFTLEFGSFQGGLDHQLPEQVYSYYQAATMSNEEGIRAKFENQRVLFDVWLDWRQLTFPLDDQTEKIFGGYHIAWNHKIGESQMEYFTQMIAYHNGGQDLSISHAVTTHMNLVNGFHITKQITDNFSLGNKSFYVQFLNTIPRSNFPYNMGYGLASEFQARWKFISGKVGYWYGNRAYQPLGDFQFSSVSEKSNYIIQNQRDVLYSHLDVQKVFFPGLTMGMRAGVYHSFHVESTDFYIGILMRFDQNFVLKK